MKDRTNISFSGGRTSAYMLRLILDSHGGSLPASYTVTFANTGMERPETLDFVDRVSREWGVDVVWLEYHRDNGEHGFRQVRYETADRTGGPMKTLISWATTLPNPRARYCTSECKIRTIKRYMKSIECESWNDCIGIRWDERDRAIGVKANCPSYINPIFPLIDAKVTEGDVMQFWAKQPFDLRLLQHEGNCDLCFLKARWKIVDIMRRKPELATQWIQWEQLKLDRVNGGKFREDRTYYGMFLESQQPTLFQMAGEDDEIPCGCADGGYRHEKEEEL